MGYTKNGGGDYERVNLKFIYGLNLMFCLLLLYYFTKQLFIF